MLLFCGSSARGARRLGPNVCFACFCLALAFESFFTIRYAFANSIRSLALVVLLFLVLRHRFEWIELDGRSDPA